MRFLLDHDVPADVGRVLRQANHEVTQVMQVLAPTARDEEVFEYARAHGMILLTCNRDDFIELAAAVEHPGLVVLVRRRSRIAECAAIVRLIANAGPSGIAENINFA